MLKIFVYGTLKPGEVNFQRFCQSSLVESYPAKAKGTLYALPEGYPAMTLPETNLYTGWVQGHILVFDDHQILRGLDELEGYEPDVEESLNEYNRHSINVITNKTLTQESAWVYVMTSKKVQNRGGILIPDGCWRANYSYFNRRSMA